MVIQIDIGLRSKIFLAVEHPESWLLWGISCTLVVELFDVWFINTAMAKTSLVSSLIHDHSIFHIVASVWDNCNYSICALGRLCKVIVGVILSTDHRRLRKQYSINFVVHSIRVIVIRCSHSLLSHLTLIHISWRLIIVSKRDSWRNYRKHIDRVKFLMSRVRSQILF